ncbi:absent in melanoma 1 protein [Trichinella spiralis]|uniref:absent in melanoma 1 protein n=1 Tax=Trichinella spiralis TaxID=6334 RepID=UPI0001EFEA4D|nr:absent in melanoma 1 protein [Trichinella spiralis]
MESKGGEGGEAAAQSAAAAWWAKATKAAVKQWKAAPDGQSAAQREKPPPDSQGQLDRRRQRSVRNPIPLSSPFRRLDRSTLFETGTKRHAAAVRRRKKT